MANYKIEVADKKTMEKWDSLIEKSNMGTRFHKLDWLRAAEKESGMDLIPLVGYKGENIILLLPVFEKTLFGFKFLFSPPPKCFIPEMGLVLLIDSNKQTRIEKDYLRSIKKLYKYLKNEYNLIKIKNSVKLSDIRPFSWLKFNVRPNYTYLINLAQKNEEIYNSFDSKLRNNIRNGEKYSGVDIKFVRQNEDQYKNVFYSVLDRFGEQNINMEVSEKYITTLWNKFKDHFIVAIARDKKSNEYLSGLILLQMNNRVLFWQGGVYNEACPYLNDLLHWETIKFLSKSDYKYYDMVGANTKHICRYKSQFNPSLKIYFEIEKSNLVGKLSKIIYRKFLK